MTTTQPTAPAATLAHTARSSREFVPLPLVGGDAVCGLSRSWWYSAESKGLIKLTRVRLPGRQRGRVLLPVPQALALLEKIGGGGVAKRPTKAGDEHTSGPDTASAA